MKVTYEIPERIYDIVVNTLAEKCCEYATGGKCVGKDVLCRKVEDCPTKYVVGRMLEII